jgi:transcriptional regulator with XRE-family HTH domain
MSNVGERIRLERQKLSYTQERLAIAADISKSFLSEVETGIRNPSAEYLLRIANALEVSLDYLMKGSVASSADPAAKRIQFPSSLSDFAMKKGLPFNVAKSILEAKLQFVANRRDAVDDDLENFDWEGFYDAIKEYL